MNKTIYLAYANKVIELRIDKETARTYTLEFNYVRTRLFKEELDVVLERGMSPTHNAVFSFDKARAIHLYNEHLQQEANVLLENQIKEEK